LFKFLLIIIPHTLDTLLRYTHKLHCLKAVSINVLYILCIGHLSDVPERTKQCGASNNFQWQYNTVKLYVQFSLFSPYKDYKNSQYINIYNKIHYTYILP